MMHPDTDSSHFYITSCDPTPILVARIRPAGMLGYFMEFHDQVLDSEEFIAFVEWGKEHFVNRKAEAVTTASTHTMP